MHTISRNNRNNRRRRMLVVVLAVAVGTASVAARAIAGPPSVATITSAWQVTSFPPGGPRDGGGWPNSGTAAGTFSISGAITDSGNLSLRFIQGAVPAPSTGLVETERVLAGGKGSITLRCFEIGFDFSNLAAVPGTGSCAVTGGTGAYSGLEGRGTLSGVLDVGTGSSTDVLDLNAV
jgi:hypothetical protein